MKKLLTKIKRFYNSDAGKVLLLVLTWQVILMVVAITFEQIIKPAGPVPTTQNLTSHTARWDSGWYLTISGDYYKSGGGHPVFYPLFPMLSKLLVVVSGGILSILEAGLLINITATFFAALALLKIGQFHLKKDRLAWLLVFLFIGYPSAFFMHAFYTEALFCALAFWAYLFAVRRQWLYMSMCLAFLSATRITALLIIGLCGLEYLRSKNWKLTKIDASIFYFLLAPLGFIIYGLYLYSVSGDFFGMLRAYDAVPDWSYQVFNPNFVETFIEGARRSIAIILGSGNGPRFDNSGLVNAIYPTAALSFLMVTSVYMLVKVRDWAVPLAVFGIVAFIFFTLNNNVVSAHRYTLPCLTIYLAIAFLVGKKPSLYAPALTLAGIFLMLQISLQALFVSGYFAG